MNKLALLLLALGEAEVEVAEDLLQLSEQHRSDHDIHHLAQDLARWSTAHARLIAKAGERAGLDLGEPQPALEVFTVGRERVEEPPNPDPEPGLRLLRDLRTLHINLVGLSVDWELLGQTAQATKNDDLLALVSRCHPDTLRQVRWTNGKIKEAAPQIMAS
jgi:hypothetical protein